MIERGRWEKLDVTERKCRLCDVVEDEYHCLVECPLFAEQRRNCLTKRLRVKPSMFDFINFMRDNSGPNRVMLATLCMRVMKEYQKYM